MNQKIKTPTEIHGQAGTHFLQLPGPTNIPQRVLSAMSQGAIDHRGPEWSDLASGVLDNLKRVLKSDDAEVFPFPASGTGAGEAAIANTLSPGDRVLVFDSGWFSSLWIKMCEKLQLDVEIIQNDWRRGPDCDAVEAILRKDREQSIQAVLVVHNETSNGVTADVAGIRQAMDAAEHSALLIVDTISSLASFDFRFDEWRVDVAIAGSQKGLMLPPGLAFNAVSPKALKASRAARLPRFFFDWQWMIESGSSEGLFPYTPPIQHFYGLQESLSMLLDEEGLEQVFARHTRLGKMTRAATSAWGFETICQNPQEYSDSVTAILLPDGRDADALRRLLKERMQLTVGAGLARFTGKAIRVGHMGSINETMLLGIIGAIEIVMDEFGLKPSMDGGAAARAALLESEHRVNEKAA